MNPRSAVGFPAIHVDALGEHRVGFGPCKGWAAPPAVVVVALEDLQHPEEGADAVVGLLHLHEAVDHPQVRRFSSWALIRLPLHLGSFSLRAGPSLPFSFAGIYLGLVDPLA